MKELIAEGKVRHFGLSEAGRADDPPRACGAAGDGAAERVFAVDARAGDQRHPAALRGTGHRLRAYSPLGKGFLTGAIERGHEVRRGRLPQRSCRASRPKRMAGQPGAGRSAQRDRRAEEGDAGADRAGLAAGAEAVDRADSRDDQDRIGSKKIWRGRSRPDGGGPRRDRARGGRDPGGGRTLSPRPARDHRALTRSSFKSGAGRDNGRRAEVPMPITETAQKNHDALFPNHIRH